MEKHKVCSFFGHRNTVLTTIQYNTLKEFIEDLVVNHNVREFLFGSRSAFDCTCHKIVTELKVTYPYLIRKCYTCKNETCTMESDRLKMEMTYSRLVNQKINLLGFEEEVEHKTKFTAGKASYVERNMAMIDDSDYCVFYYNDNYLPDLKKYSKRNSTYYQPKSGTKLAFNYANQRKKIIYNIYSL